MLNGIAWKAISGIATQISRIVVAILLARLLTPQEFGYAAAVLVLAALAGVLTDPALGVALIQRKTITEKDRSTVFWTSATLGALFALVALACSGLLADLYGEPGLQPYFAVFSFTFLLMGLQTTQASVMARNLQFRGLELRTIAGTIAGGVVGVVVAFRGGGTWAIVWQSLTMTAVSTVLLWSVSGWRPRLIFSSASLRSLGGMGLKAYGSRVVWFLNSNTDTVLIGRFLGPTSLGAYALAFNLMLFPITRIAGPLRGVLFPAFSRIQDDRERMVAGWLRGSRMIAVVAMPAMFGMMAIAPDFVPVVLGERWREAIPVLQILAIVGLLQALQVVGGSTLNAVGLMGTTLAFTIASYAANVAAFVAGLQWGINGVAVAYAIATAALFPVFTWLVARSMKCSAWDYVRALWGVLQASLLMLASVVALRSLLVEQGVPQGARLVILVLVGAAVYVGACIWRAPELTQEIREIRRRRGGGHRGPGAPAAAGAKR